MEYIGYGVLCFVAIFMVISFIRSRPTVLKLQEQQEKYEAILRRFQVPKTHDRIVIGQSKVYRLNNCPAIVWMEDTKVKILILRLNPILAESDIEDFRYIASQPLLDFKRFDGTEYPDWAVQTAYIKEQFLPYVTLTHSVGGIDYKKQMYWIGTICVYAPSLAAILTMLQKPLSWYEIRVDDPSYMKTDGSIPADLLNEYHDLPRKHMRQEEHTRQEQKIGQEDKTGQGKPPIGMDEALQNLKEALELVKKAGNGLEDGKEASSETERVNKLVRLLLEEGRSDELLRSTTDPAYQKELFEQYRL